MALGKGLTAEGLEGQEVEFHSAKPLLPPTLERLLLLALCQVCGTHGEESDLRAHGADVDTVLSPAREERPREDRGGCGQPYPVCIGREASEKRCCLKALKGHEGSFPGR